MNAIEYKIDLIMKYIAAADADSKNRARDEIAKCVNVFDSQAETVVDKNKIDDCIDNLLKELGVPANLLGYDRLAYALKLIYSDNSYLDKITSRLYPDIAAQFSSTPARVERAIRHAIIRAWTRGDYDTYMYIFGNSIDPNKGKPTNSEFFAVCARVLHRRMRDI